MHKKAESENTALWNTWMYGIHSSLPFARLSDRYDWKKGMTDELFKYTPKFCRRFVWSTKSKAS